jgi:DNA replication protein DnaC
MDMIKANLKASTSAVQYECSKCQDTGTINEYEWVESDILLKDGSFMKIERAKVDPTTGYPPICECHFEKTFQKYNASLGMRLDDLQHTFKNAVIDEDNEPHYRIASEFVKNIDKHRDLGTWIYIFGDEERARDYGCSAYGTGKTYLMNCIANALTLRRIPSLYVTEDKLFADIKSTYNRNSDESETDVLNRYYKVPILFIDDLFSAQYDKEWAEAKLFGILNNRLGNKKITIMTSNYATNRISLRLPINGAKIGSRIIGECQQIEMIGKDRRISQAKKKHEQRREWAV